MKTKYDKITANIIVNNEKLKTFPLKSARKQGCPYSSLIVLGILNTPFKEEKDIKRILFGTEEVKLSVFAHDIILYTENPRDATRKLLELINE